MSEKRFIDTVRDKSDEYAVDNMLKEIQAIIMERARLGFYNAEYIAPEDYQLNRLMVLLQAEGFSVNINLDVSCLKISW